MTKYIRPVIVSALVLLTIPEAAVTARGILVQQGNTLQLFRQDGTQVMMEPLVEKKEVTIENSAPSVITPSTAMAPTKLRAAVSLYSSPSLQIMADSRLASPSVVPDMRPLINTELQQITPVYELSGLSGHELVISAVYDSPLAGRLALYRYRMMTNSWERLPSYNNIDERRVIATFIPLQSAERIVILSDDSALDGKASWYDQSKYRTFNYQGGMFAAHRTYPKGTKLKVTRLKTGESIIVTINDWGPEEWTGRIIDLEKQAFQAIATTGAGEVYVSVEKIN